MLDFLRELLEASSGSRLRRYGGVLAVVVVATVLRWLLDPALGDRRPYLTYGLALIFTAWRFGVAPSVLTLFLILPTGAYYFTSPRHSMQVLNFHYWAQDGGLALLTGFSIIFLFGTMGAA